MTLSGWLDLLASGSDALYVFGAYAVALALFATELVLLLLRTHAIRGHLGWHGDALDRNRVSRRGSTAH